jgi:hypothetical protein
VLKRSLVIWIYVGVCVYILINAWDSFLNILTLHILVFIFLMICNYGYYTSDVHWAAILSYFSKYYIGLTYATCQASLRHGNYTYLSYWAVECTLLFLVQKFTGPLNLKFIVKFAIKFKICL